MSSAKQNFSIAKLIVGAMTIDGNLDATERKKVIHTLEKIGMAELIADVGAAIEEDDGNFNMHKECKALIESLGADAKDVTPLIFRVITDVVASDRFVSQREASYMSSMANRLQISSQQAKKIFAQVMADRRGRLEIAASSVNEAIHANLKDLLSFDGSEKLVGELDADSVEEMMHSVPEERLKITRDDVARALAVLGLDGRAKLEHAEDVWQETIENLNLPKMSRLGETFVSAAIGRITRINEAYKTILHFHEHVLNSHSLDESHDPVTQNE